MEVQLSRLSRAVEILDAAERWKNECLLAGGSLLSDERLWTNEIFEELHTRFVKHPDEGNRSFEEKLYDQLEPASAEAKLLWAELTWVYFLVATSIKGDTKLKKIKTVYEWSGLALPEDHWALSDVLDKGVCNPGMNYLLGQWREFQFIIVLMLHWTKRSERERQSMISDARRFATWIDDLEGDWNCQFRHAMLFLLFPDHFEPIVSLSHKRDIVKAFNTDAGDKKGVDNLSRAKIDEALLTTRRRLEDQRTDVEVEINFYDEDLKAVWQRNARRQTEIVPVDGVDDESWYQDRFGTNDVWVIAPGKGAHSWMEFLTQGFAAVGWNKLGDLSEYGSRSQMHSALIENGAGDNPSNQSLALWEFVHEIKVGDIILAKRGRSAILGWGEVSGEYRHEPDRADYRNLRTVEWHPCHAPVELTSPIATKTLTRFTGYKSWLRYVFQLIEDDRMPGKQDKLEPEPYSVDTALEELFLEDVQFHRILNSIRHRKNLILQGPPGVGKTYIARRIAWCLVGHRDSASGSIEMVQFHQSYAYEDFVQGWRPTEAGGFRLRNGVFVEFCKHAAQHPDQKFIFIIDEINRGNLSRIFGELLMLIEEDKRGEEFAIPLTYSDSVERFSVPDNIYILGLMNTADRSLSIVDYALRRRFAFGTLEPAFGTEKFRMHLLNAGAAPSLVDRINLNLAALNESIRSDKDLGPGFEVGHSYFVPSGHEESANEHWYQGIIEEQIVPLLREYWFDRLDYAKQQAEGLLR